MSAQHRKYSLDPSPDNAPCPSPAWLVDVLDRGRALGLHPSQRDAIEWLLGSIEADDLPPPTLCGFGKGPASSLAVIWPGDGWLVEAHLFLTCGGSWRARLYLCREGELIACECPRHPGHYLRTMLGRVFVGLFAGEGD